MNKYDIGLAGEESASAFLEKKGYTVISRRMRIGHSEIDIIAHDEEYLIFAEVKTRRTYPDALSPYGTPSSSVDRKKQGYLLRAAQAFLRENHEKYGDKFFRIDVIEVYADPNSEEYRVLKIEHIMNAVKKTGKFSL